MSTNQYPFDKAFHLLEERAKAGQYTIDFEKDTDFIVKFTNLLTERDPQTVGQRVMRHEMNLVPTKGFNMHQIRLKCEQLKYLGPSKKRQHLKISVTNSFKEVAKPTLGKYKFELKDQEFNLKDQGQHYWTIGDTHECDLIVPGVAMFYGPQMAIRVNQVDGQVEVQDLTKGTIWQETMIRCAFTNKEEARDFANWHWNNIHTGMVLNFIGKMAYEVTEILPQLKLELMEGQCNNQTDKLNQSIVVDYDPVKNLCVLGLKQIGKMAGVSAQTIGLQKDDQNRFGNFAPYHTYKLLRTAQESREGKQSQFIKLEQDQEIYLQKYFLKVEKA